MATSRRPTSPSRTARSPSSSGEAAGVFTAVMETTEHVLASAASGPSACCRGASAKPPMPTTSDASPRPCSASNPQDHPLAVMVDARALPEDPRDLEVPGPLRADVTPPRRRRSPEASGAPGPAGSRPPRERTLRTGRRGTPRLAHHVAERRRDVRGAHHRALGAPRMGSGSRDVPRPLRHPSRDRAARHPAARHGAAASGDSRGARRGEERLLHQPQSRAAHTAHLDQRSDL